MRSEVPGENTEQPANEPEPEGRQEEWAESNEVTSDEDYLTKLLKAVTTWIFTDFLQDVCASLQKNSEAESKNGVFTA